MSSPATDTSSFNPDNNNNKNDNAASSTCINQAQAALLLVDNDNLCQKLNPDQLALQTNQALRHQYETYIQRLNKLKADYDLSALVVNASNKAAVATDHVNMTNNNASSNKRQQLSKYNGDTMTAERVVTLNQQNLLHTNVVIGHMQYGCIVFGIAVLLMFPFAFTPVRTFFKHPTAVMQSLLIVLAAVSIVILILRLWANRNHYHMLYQERVFKFLRPEASTQSCDCGPDSTEDSPVTSDSTDDDTCGT